MSAPTIPFALYNPALLSAETLLGEFIARRPLLDTLIATIRENAAGHAPQHLLLVGARGMGKTTTLWAIAHTVNRDPRLAREWQPVVFDEESRRIGDLADFWLEAIRQWEHATKDPHDRTQALLDQPTSDIEERARQVFIDTVARSGRRALLLIDNLNDVLASIRDPEPLHRLRAFLMEESRVMLIGGATRQFPEITEVDQPFYDFFRTIELKPLSLDEMKECLLSLARRRADAMVERAIQEREGTMRSLHLLTGGNPRLIRTFYRLLAEGLRGDIRTDLERLLDEFTPYFKSIVDALPVQQQRILDAVALHWDPVDVATVARITRLPSNQVSAQLRALVKIGHVAEPAGHPKRKTYLLADRFSNIHYLMRHGRAARSRFDWFVAILQLIFPDKAYAENLAKVARLTAECGDEGRRDARDLMRSALSRAVSAESRRQLVEETLRESWSTDALNSLSEWFDQAEARQHMPESDVLAFFKQMPTALRKELGFKPEDYRWWWALTEFLQEKEAWELAESAYRKSLQLNPAVARIWSHLGRLLFAKLKRFREAEAAFRKAIELAPQDTSPLIGLGQCFQAQDGRETEVEKLYRKALELDPDAAITWGLLGMVLLEPLRRIDEAEAALRKALELDDKIGFVWECLGDLLQAKSPGSEGAEAAFRRAIDLDSTWVVPVAELVRLLGGRPDGLMEARTLGRRALLMDPSSICARYAFLQVSNSQSDDWLKVLPSLVSWCASNPSAQETFTFTLDGFIRFARLTAPSEAIALLDSVPAAAEPFETLRDALLAAVDRNHLERLAPERRVVAIELMNRISAPPKGNKEPGD